jgi:hypothetical protein
VLAGGGQVANQADEGAAGAADASALQAASQAR